ncbi:YXWGXW repeat-containing protein [Paraburkholderia caballeronis]|uniref:YXWGXW repeat-containing protein n=1 Tax=Paraburkholderia caballeronis TaxID=416943 RepID=A0A1H7TH73_9BURK|nr:YXWGXW repeat-containing protein [Paraburkholderia caballeronis]PXW18360.1 YXWGXW repeat-containing protein [Paraburkholderia caballeronis]PXW95640.1 YXWGXW repeat-containing protein [Paraburkholderia caballeronis]RAJ91986.1 YXWGXW repeat-containing protein [Paraburkholderia caballeronis]SEB80035.1 YXWGXW repeat-containing protein [Paraburkholderia caballeronis]SEL83744.1 YXWGXW repeat-containing protein [Paraburkholderia caballeronis]
MNKSIRVLLAKAAFVGAGIGAIAAPAFADVIVVAPSAPPPLRAEVVPGPRAGYVWDRGHWRWDRGHYVWIAGHWETVHAGRHWLPGHWVHAGPNWRWVGGRWA